MGVLYICTTYYLICCRIKRGGNSKNAKNYLNGVSREINRILQEQPAVLTIFLNYSNRSDSVKLLDTSNTPSFNLRQSNHSAKAVTSNVPGGPRSKRMKWPRATRQDMAHKAEASTNFVILSNNPKIYLSQW